MLQAKELRIGNWVSISKDNKQSYISVSQIKNRGIVYHNLEERSNHILFENLHPIPLTTEILEKCGFNILKIKEVKFNNAKFGDECWINDFMIFFVENAFNEECYYTIQPSRGIPQPKLIWLHQLQNLYYELSGEELIFNL